MQESKLWLLHILCGVVVLVLLALHMGLMHLDGLLVALGVGTPDPTDAASVFVRSRQISFMIIYIALLGAALYHGFYGLRNVLLELSPKTALAKIINICCLLAGLALLVYGTYTAVWLVLT